MMKLNKAQRKSLHELYKRGCAEGATPTQTYRQFRKTVRPLFGDPTCVMVPWCGMWVGIESDGYAHS